jgi:hypothetical protein
MRAVRARIFALLAALVMLLPSGASARTQYYCRMMGRVVASSACDSKASKAASPVRELQPADCCQRLSSSSRSASLGTLEAVHDVAPAASVAASQSFVVGLFGDSEGFCAESRQAVLAIGPPLFLVHCALLS